MLLFLFIGVLCICSACGSGSTFNLREADETFVFTDKAVTPDGLPGIDAETGKTDTVFLQESPAPSTVAGYTAAPTKSAVSATDTSSFVPTPQEQPADVPSASATEAVGEYVLNVGSKKFHYPTCSSVKQIKPENLQNVSLRRDTLIEEGYTPCKRCNP